MAMLAAGSLPPDEARGLPAGRVWTEADTFLVPGHPVMFAPGRIERDSAGGILILGEAVSDADVGTTAAALRWADSLWVPFWELGDNISLLWPVAAPEHRHVFVGLTTDGLGPNRNQDYLIVGELRDGRAAYVDSVALLTAANFGYSAAASDRRRWASAYGATTLSGPRLGRVFYSDTIGIWHEIGSGVASGNYGTALLALDDTTAVVAFASIDPPHLTLGTVRGTTWDAGFPEPRNKRSAGAPRIRHREPDGLRMIWASNDSLYLSEYSNGAWGPTQGIPCTHADPAVHTPNSNPHIGPSAVGRPVLAWGEYNTRIGVHRVCLCIPDENGFPPAEEILEPNGTLPVVLRDENGDIWLAWFRFFGGMYWQHTYVTATATDVAIGGHAGTRALTWILSEPAPKSRWAVLRSRNDGPFEVAAHVIAHEALTMSWIDSSPPAGVLRYKLRRECLDTRYQWESAEVRWPIRSQRPIRFTQVARPLMPGQTLELSGAVTGTVHISLFDIQGRLVYQRRWQASGSGIDRIPFDAGRPVSSGVYFLRAVDASGSVSTPARIVLLR